MKKRLFCVLLAVMMLFPMIAHGVPTADAAGNAGYQALLDFVKEKGTAGGSSSFYAYWYSVTKTLQEPNALQEQYEFRLAYTKNNELEISELYHSGGDSCSIRVIMNKDGTYNDMLVSCLIGEADYKLQPSAFQLTTQLKAYQYRGESEVHDRLDKYASSLLKEALEELQKILVQKGKNLSAIGFSKYSAGHQHNWSIKAIETQPTCTYGEEMLTCSTCKSIRVIELNPVKDHTWGDWQVLTEPNCVEQGEKIRYCQVCGDRRYESIPATGIHQWKKDEESSVAPTCVNVGWDKYRCIVCGEMKTEYLPATGIHLWDAGTVQQEPTCTENGKRIHTCETCRELWIEELPALGHVWTLTEVLTEEESAHASMGLYTCSRCNETKEARLCAAEVFTDMPAEGNWAHAPIDWAYFDGITAGKTANTFAPKYVVTRAEAMTFLWKVMGSPEPETQDNPFTDVPEGKYFYKPVMWAVENGVTSGATETTFAPKQKCSRAQIMMFLWAAAGKPEPDTEENPFTDVSENKYYYKAVLWAVENGITGGIAADKFGPNNTCTRAQIVTFLYKAQPLLTTEPDPDPALDPITP